MSVQAQSISTVPANLLQQSDIDAWLRLLPMNPILESPFLRPEYVQAVARHLHGVEVIVVRQGDEAVAFLPVQRREGRRAGPVGGILCDYQGLVAGPDTAISPPHLLAAAGLQTWEFDHLLAEQAPFKPYQFVQAESPQLHVEGGMKAYLGRRQSASSSRIKRLQQKGRQAERHCGSITFTFNDPSPEAFELLVAWKREHFRRGNAVDIFSIPTTLPIFHDIMSRQTEGFGGVLSTLRFAGRPVAAWFAMRSHGVLHQWVSSYDREVVRFSPGMLAILRCIEVSDDVDIQIIDFGKGPEQYKDWFKTGAVALAEGAVVCNGPSLAIRKAALRLKNRVVNSRLRSPARWAARGAATVLPQVRTWLHMRPEVGSSESGGSPK